MSFEPQELLDLIELGGPVVAVLIAMSVYALALTGLKLWQFRAVHLGDRKFTETSLAFWQAGDHHRALESLRQSRNPIATCMRTVMEGSVAGIAEATLRAEASRKAARDLNILRRHLRPLEVIGNLAPLLGLFGTVVGMIAAFAAMEAAGSQVDPSVLSGGIWEALLTTAVGLAVAIPAIAILNFLERKVDTLQEDMQDVLTRVFTARAFRSENETGAAPSTEGGDYNNALTLGTVNAV
ncbi:MotA/TolQ/ExbB proton channel family protein [Gilvimarinus sp. F26214L]|uniref:MotA/TolQ/ExbB proton channel family protein n=1 Tax=Gilvimarinus sp. DZF01 TaxID=3461371 RepID=UPI004045CF2F